MAVHEPMTVITDYLLAALCLGCGWRLMRSSVSQRQLAPRLWAWGLLAMGAGALLGGTYHGIGPDGPGVARVALWKGALVCIGIADWCMLWAATRASFRRPLRTWLTVAVTLKVAVYVVWMSGHDAYRYVIWESVASMLLLVGIQLGMVQRREGGPWWIVGAVAVAFVAARVQRSELVLGWFNHNDLYHVIQMPGVWLFYRGGLRLHDRD